MDKLFVYGTLKPGFPNHYILKNIGGSFIKATLFGFEYDKNWEKQTGYPGIITSEPTKKIDGFVFVSKNLKYNWKVLDDFETKAYTRKQVSISLHNKKEEVFVYTINIDFDLNQF